MPECSTPLNGRHIRTYLDLRVLSSFYPDEADSSIEPPDPVTLLGASLPAFNAVHFVFYHQL